MLQAIYIDPELSKRLDLLRRSGKKAALAAAKADEIIKRMQSGKVRPRRAGTVTKHGEARIKGVIKYDLGSGYRLVTFKHGDCLFILFAGHHDGCHRWIENNRELDIDIVYGRCIKLPADSGDVSWPEAEAGCLEMMPEQDHDPLQHIAEKDLRQIFCGLIEGAP